MRRLFLTLIVSSLALIALTGSADRPGDPPPDLSAQLILNRTAVFAQEPFEAVIELIYRGGDVDPRVRLTGVAIPGVEWTGFHELRGESIRRNGTRYEVRRFRSRGRGVAPGRLRFEPKLEVLWQSIGADGDAQDNWAFFYGRRPPVRRLTVLADPVEIEVRPLPEEGRPPTFAGAVGRFDLDVELDRTATRVGEPVSLRTAVEGEGNIEQIRPPIVEAGESFRVYQPRLIAHEYDPVRSRGRKVYEFVLLPRAAGAVEISSVAFDYFDPRSGAYRTRTHGPLALEVAPGVSAPEPWDENDDVPAALPREDRPAPIMISAFRRRWLSEEARLRLHHAAAAAAESDWEEAARSYLELDAAGYADREVLFNLGLAFESMGDRARAVWYYLRAMRTRPYDAFLRQQLSRALWQAGAPGYTPSAAPGHWLRFLPAGVWSGLLPAGGAGLAAGLALLIWTRSVRRFAVYAAGTGLVLLLFGLAGRTAWAWADREPEAVVIGRDVAARFAPAPEHAVHFYLPHAAIVRIVRTAEGWNFVEMGGRKGWAPVKAFASLDLEPGAWPERREDAR